METAKISAKEYLLNSGYEGIGIFKTKGEYFIKAMRDGEDYVFWLRYKEPKNKRLTITETPLTEKQAVILAESVKFKNPSTAHYCVLNVYNIFSRSVLVQGIIDAVKVA